MLGKQTTQQFIQLRLADTLQAAQTRLNENPGYVAVIIDEEARPVTLVTGEDLAKVVAPADRLLSDIVGQLPPGVVGNATMRLEDLSTSAELTAFSAGARGVIVYDESQLAGIVSANTIRDFLRDEFELLGELRGMAADTRLAGDIVNEPIIIYCAAHNHRNELAYYNRRKPPQCRVKTPKSHHIREEK